MADQENKLSIIYSNKDDQYIAVIKEQLKPLEAYAALSFWEEDYAIEDFSIPSKQENAWRQLYESEQFILLLSADLLGKKSKEDEIREKEDIFIVRPTLFDTHVKRFLHENTTAKDSLYSIIVRPYDKKGIGIDSAVTIPKLGVPLSAYHAPEKVLEAELSEIKNAIYQRMLLKRLSNISEYKFSETNLQRIARYFIPGNDSFNLSDELLEALSDGKIEQLLTLSDET